MEYWCAVTHAAEGVVIWIAIVEDHPIVRQGLIAVLEDVEDFGIAWTAGSAEQGLDLATRVPADVALVDLMLPGMSGVDMIPLLIASTFGPRVLVFTAFAAHEQVLGAIKAGAAGYVLKGTDAADLIRAVRGVAGGGTVLEPLVAERVAAAIRAPRGAGTLTFREREVLQLLAGGLPGKQIGRALGISERTVKFHVSALTRKLGADNRAQAVAQAARRGLLDADPER